MRPRGPRRGIEPMPNGFFRYNFDIKEVLKIVLTAEVPAGSICRGSGIYLGMETG